jgi:hypothetical protein
LAGVLLRGGCGPAGQHGLQLHQAGYHSGIFILKKDHPPPRRVWGVDICWCSLREKKYEGMRKRGKNEQKRRKSEKKENIILNGKNKCKMGKIKT